MRAAAAGFLLFSLVLALVFLPVHADAQEEDTEETGKQEESLFRSTLALDIRTAGYYDLVTWCKQLDLDTSGSREDLQKRLYTHYEISSPPAGEPEGTIITIESAALSEYFTIEEVEENYIVMTGGVVLKVEDTEENTIHRISAERLVFNQTEKKISAQGNVEYTLEREEEIERFQGNQIEFNLDTWEGAFISGTTEKPRTVGEEEITFSISGDVITRSSEDVVVLEEGSITSSNPENPNYQIKAEKIWVLGAGEWGLQNGVLYVGRIPVLYIPFFFRPGDEIIFHPNFGYRDREGYFFQTSTYLYGRAPQSDASFSFLQATEPDNKQFEKIRKGVFLRATDRKLPEEASGWFVRFMADFYTRLGVFAGIDAEFDSLGFLDEISLNSGFGFSRNIYQDRPGVQYTPYYEGKTYWNDSYLFTQKIPFRYEFALSMSLSEGNSSLNLDVPLYSDPYFERDFRDRSESIEWSELLGIELEDTGTDTDVTIRDKLFWNLQGKTSLPTEAASPYLEKISLNYATFSINWRTKSISQSLLEPHEYVDPGNTYYYPEKATYPDLSASVSGTILSYPPDKQNDNVNELLRPSPEIDIKRPWDSQSGDESNDSDGDEKSPGIIGPVEDITYVEPFSSELSYRITPQFTVDTTYYSEDLAKPEDIDMEGSYSSFTNRNDIRLNYQGALYKKLLELDNSSVYSTSYRNHYNRNSKVADTEWEDIFENDAKYNSMKLSNSSSLASYPFFQDDLWGESNITYDLDLIIYRRVFDELTGQQSAVYKDEAIEWDKEYITNHQLGTSLIVKPWKTREWIDLNVELPPLNRSFSALIGAEIGPSTTKISQKYQEDDNGIWTAEPLVLLQDLEFSENFSVRERIEYNTENNYFQASESSLDAWFLNASFTAEYTDLYDFNSLEWEKTGREDFVPSKLNVGLDMDYTSDPFWKGRARYSAGASADWEMDLIRFTNNQLDIAFDFGFKIHKFMDFSFRSVTRNESTYRYFPALSKKLEQAPRNIVSDIIRSFNFFRPEDRYDSPFNLQRIEVGLIHHLDDWDLEINYIGEPQLNTQESVYEWIPTLSILLQWKPVPEIKSEFEADESGISF
ncbi:MAG: hypothetical protein K9L68_12935 [Spirochaetales bacterium]|nr:hypothetical protein [Spirochaetales bacterium]